MPTVMHGTVALARTRNGVDVPPDLRRNDLLVGLILLKTAGVGQSRSAQDTNLGKRLRTLSCSQTPELTTTPLLLVNS